MMTPRQRQVLAFVGRQISEKGFAPSFDDIAWALKMKSRSSVSRIVDTLEEREYVQRLPNVARGLSVTDAGWVALRTGSTCPCCGAPMKGGA